MLTIFSETVQLILGDSPISYYLAGFFFSGLAVLISVYHHSKKRDIPSPSTPVCFSWSFLLWDNFKRMFITLIVMFMLFRIWDLSNPAAMIGVGFFVAFSLDKAIQYIMEYTNLANFLKTDREKFKAKHEN